MWPRRLAVLCQRHGWSTAVATVSAFGAMIFVLLTMRPSEGDGFYALMSHAAMVTIFLPAFVLPLLSLSVGMRAYWREIGGRPVTRRDLFAAIRDAASLRSLNGGHGDGCNFEQDNRFSHQRRWAHHAVLYGFLLCFAATSCATVLQLFLSSLATPSRSFRNSLRIC